MIKHCGFAMVAMAASLCCTFMAGCDKLEKTGRSATRKAGEIVGKGSAEFFSGVGEGIEDVTNNKRPDVLTAISERRSVRKFDATKPVDDATVIKLLKSAMCAPTAQDKRPWEFVVVRDSDKLARIAEKLPYSRVGNGAQLAIVICGDTAVSGLWAEDCSAASMNLLLAAHGLGLGAVWTDARHGDDRISALREILGIPDRVIPLNVIPIGYPGEEGKPKDKWNPTKIHYDQW